MQRTNVRKSSPRCFCVLATGAVDVIIKISRLGYTALCFSVNDEKGSRAASASISGRFVFYAVVTHLRNSCCCSQSQCLWRGVRWFETDFSGLPVGPIFKGQGVQKA